MLIGGLSNRDPRVTVFSDVSDNRIPDLIKLPKHSRMVSVYVPSTDKIGVAHRQQTRYRRDFNPNY